MFNLKAVDFVNDTTGRTVCTVSIPDDDAREVFYKGDPISKADVYSKLPAGIVNRNYEKAMDDIYDLPMFDGAYITTRSGDFTVRIKATRIDEEDDTMKYLNAHKQDLFERRKVTYRGKVYWANMTTREIYAHSVDEELAGSISGYKVADITDDWEIRRFEE